MSALEWKQRLAKSMDPTMAAEIDVFEKQIELRKLGKVDEKVFAETRLRRGVYGQRYDNGQRHDGIASQPLSFPSGDIVKGPDTMWDAPGMMRIKIPFGRLDPEQLEMLADLSEEYADGISHVTTRQDIQLHFVHIEDTPTLMRRLAAVGITTREACGNSVRNVTACQFAGTCADEPFDVTPYADALTNFLLGHDDAQSFGRKFKVAFSGCAHQPCGLTTIHDMGLIAKTKDGERGFELYVGGGLGSVPRHRARCWTSSWRRKRFYRPRRPSARDLRDGTVRRETRSRARLKFLHRRSWGMDEVHGRAVFAERAKLLGTDPRWTSVHRQTLTKSRRETAQAAGSNLVRRSMATPDSAFEQMASRPIFADATASQVTSVRHRDLARWEIITQRVRLRSAGRHRGVANSHAVPIRDNGRTELRHCAGSAKSDCGRVV